MSAPAVLRWNEGGEARSALWLSEGGVTPPARVLVADERITADEAYRLVSQGTAILWRGDFQNARQILLALMRRVDGRASRKPGTRPPVTGAAAFHAHRMARGQRARTLGMLLVPFEAGYRIPLRRAPDVGQACAEAHGPCIDAGAISLRELQGLIAAHEWRRKGVEIPALGASIHPHYGVFSPIRGEYVRLVAQAPLPATDLAFDIGCGTGVLAAVLARRGVARVIATDSDTRALACARENIARLGIAARVEVTAADLFPPGRASLVVCNPPWLPGRPASPLERSVYDHESRMLRGFLLGLAAHLGPGGEGWLILSDLAEHLGLRARDELPVLIEKSGLRVIARIDARPSHPKAADAADPLHAARRAEVTTLWRLAVH